jgi:hypothetical protein
MVNDEENSVANRDARENRLQPHQIRAAAQERNQSRAKDTAHPRALVGKLSGS